MIKEFKVGDILSESSHYTVTSISGDTIELKHHESGDGVYINKMYIRSILNLLMKLLKK